MKPHLAIMVVEMLRSTVADTLAVTEFLKARIGGASLADVLQIGILRAHKVGERLVELCPEIRTDPEHVTPDRARALLLGLANHIIETLEHA